MWPNTSSKGLKPRDSCTDSLTAKSKRCIPSSQSFSVSKQYRIRGNFHGLPIFAVFRGQYESAKIKIAKYFPISVKESSLEATSIFAAVTSILPLLR